MKTLQKKTLRSYYSTGFVKKSWRHKVEVTANHFKESALNQGEVGWAQEGETALGQIQDFRNNGRKVFQKRRRGYGWIPFAPQEGRAEEWTQKESIGSGSWRLFWLFGKLSALPSYAWHWGQQLLPNTTPTSHRLSLHCHSLSPARGHQELPAELSGIWALGHVWIFTLCQGSHESLCLKELNGKRPYIRCNFPPLALHLTIQGSTE